MKIFQISLSEILRSLTSLPQPDRQHGRDIKRHINPHKNKAKSKLLYINNLQTHGHTDYLIGTSVALYIRQMNYIINVQLKKYGGNYHVSTSKKFSDDTFMVT